MVYKNNFVVSVKCDGKILREKEGNIYIPFGSDYSLIMKNLDSRRAFVSVEIDGKDVLNGSRLVINGNTTSKLKGFLENNTVKNKFRFIEKTEEISEYRGDRIDDGLIRVEVTFENKYDFSYITDPSIWYIPKQIYGYPKNFTYTNYDWSCNSDYSACYRALSCNDLNTNDSGITVKGQETKQNFNTTSLSGTESEKTVIVLSLKGYKSDNKVQKPLFVKDKIKCSSCGKNNKSNSKYCTNCGTFLE